MPSEDSRTPDHVILSIEDTDRQVLYSQKLSKPYEVNDYYQMTEIMRDFFGDTVADLASDIYEEHERKRKERAMIDLFKRNK